VRSGAGFFPQYLRQHWNKIAIAAASGVLAGFLAAAVSSRENPPLTQVVYAAGATTQPALASQEVSQLRAENEHLQALIDQLQKAHPAARAHKAKVHRRRSHG